ncbi:tripartite tricarboxylate transporter TctB family protein [Sulfitobacter sp. LCG007]
MEADRVRRARIGEAALLLFLLVGGPLLMAETFRFQVVPWDPLGMAFWPRIQLSLGCAVILARLCKLRASGAPDPGDFARGLGVLAVCVVYVVAVGAIGQYLATPLFFLSFAVLRGSDDRRQGVLAALIAALVVLLSVWLLFDEILGLRVVSLPYWMR